MEKEKTKHFKEFEMGKLAVQGGWEQIQGTFRAHR